MRIFWISTMRMRYKGIQIEGVKIVRPRVTNIRLPRLRDRDCNGYRLVSVRLSKEIA